MRPNNPWRRSVLLAVLAFAGPAPGAEVAPSMLVIERYAAERGDANAQYFMGEHHEHGDSGVDKDLAKALDLYGKAAKQKHGPAQFKLGVFHEKGLAGLAPDMTTALDWYRRAAQNGSELAQQRLAEAEEGSAKNSRKEQERKTTEKQRKTTEKQRDTPAAARDQPAPQAAAVPASMTISAKKARPSFDASALVDHVLGAKWEQSGRPAEFLPASDMSCLKTAAGEITCFSKERRRMVANQEATFSLKAVLSRFSDSGTFDVSYNYNVTDLRAGSPSVTPGDEYGLLQRSGWQQPGLSAHCELDEPGRIHCSGPHKKTWEFRGG